MHVGGGWRCSSVGRALPKHAWETAIESRVACLHKWSSKQASCTGFDSRYLQIIIFFTKKFLSKIIKTKYEW